MNEAMQLRIQTWLENAERNMRESRTSASLNYYAGCAAAFADVLELDKKERGVS